MSCVLSTLLRPWTVWLPPLLLALLCQVLTCTAAVLGATALYAYARAGDSGPVAAADPAPAARAATAGADPILYRLPSA